MIVQCVCEMSVRKCVKKWAGQIQRRVLELKRGNQSSGFVRRNGFLWREVFDTSDYLGEK